MKRRAFWHNSPGGSYENESIQRNANCHDFETRDAGIKVKDLCREHGISDAMYYNWKAKYGGLEASDLKGLKKTEDELAKLKRMYADLALENQALKDLIEKKNL
ncbi:MAG: hypothetical protein NPIRA01_36000 [Nitrospirales bacterium]|nr:MAG: hypothetical protein NPIRA01_36000 [Nitrospirales bacterium]